MKAYFISGLGCDRRAFQRVSLPDEFEIIHLDWIMPDGEETIGQYSIRMAAAIDTSGPFILVGLSFGGMVAVEISKFKKPVKLFLISSVACRAELPFFYRLCGRLHLDKIVPASWLTNAKPLLYFAFGPLDHETRPLFDVILRDTSTEFLQWALGVIARWKNDYIPGNPVRIHGANDRIFPVGKLGMDYLLAAGGHFCVYIKGPEVSRIIEECMPES